MTAGSLTIDDAGTAQARSAAFSLVAHGFRYPDELWLQLLRDEARWDAWPALLAGICPGLSEEVSAVRAALARPDRAALLDDFQEQHVSLFGHSVRGTAPPYELEYGRSEVIQRASDLADISGFYAAFGMEPTGGVNERADHISVEAEFLSTLCDKEAYGVENGNGELIEAIVDAQRKFLDSHLARWLPAFARRVTDADPEGLYARLSSFARVLMNGESGRLGVSLGSPYLELRPTDPVQETSQSCGLPDECAPGGTKLTQINVNVQNGGA